MNKPTVRASNPEAVIEIMGDSFAELLLFHAEHAENMRRVGLALENVCADAGQDERLMHVAAVARAMAGSASAVLVELVRVGTSQGLVLEISDGKPNVTH